MRSYYRALYAQQIGSLLGGGAQKNLPGMRNLAMELRKLCCHPVSEGCAGCVAGVCYWLRDSRKLAGASGQWVHSAQKPSPACALPSPTHGPRPTPHLQVEHDC
jgi:hypothetical protein